MSVHGDWFGSKKQPIKKPITLGAGILAPNHPKIAAVWSLPFSKEDGEVVINLGFEHETEKAINDLLNDVEKQEKETKNPANLREILELKNTLLLLKAIPDYYTYVIVLNPLFDMESLKSVPSRKLILKKGSDAFMYLNEAQREEILNHEICKQIIDHDKKLEKSLNMSIFGISQILADPCYSKLVPDEIRKKASIINVCAQVALVDKANKWRS